MVPLGALAAALAAAAPTLSPPDLPIAADSECLAGVACRSGLNAAQVLDLAAASQAAGRTAEAATLLAVLAADQDGEIRAEARFRLGLLRAATGDYAAAAAQFRATLAERPGAARVRLELARVLALQGDDGPARRELRQAQAAGLPEDVARTVDRFQTALRSRRRLGASIEAGIAPDSNINRANGDATVEVGPATVTLDRDAQARSGVGAALKGQGFWRPRLATDLDALATLSVSADLYGASRFDDVAATAALGPELTRGRARYRLQAVAGRRWFGGNGYSNTAGATASLIRRAGRTAQIELDLSALDIDYLVNDAMDGWQYAAQGRYERALGTRLYGRATALLQRQDARDAAFASWTYGGELLLSRDLGWLSAYASAGYYRTEGDGAFTFPGAARDDDLVTLEGGLVLKRLAFSGFAPVVRLRHLANRSPVFFYDFRQTRVEMALTRDF